MDWMATILAITSLSDKPKRQLDGINVNEFLLGEKEPLERTVMWNDNTLRSGKMENDVASEGHQGDTLV